MGSAEATDLRDGGDRLGGLDVVGTLANIENLTIAEVREQLAATLVLVERLEQEALTQQATVARLRDEIEQQQKRLAQAKSQADTAATITAAEIEMLGNAIMQQTKRDAKQSAWGRWWMGMLMGVTASLIAGLILNSLPVLEWITQR